MSDAGKKLKGRSSGPEARDRMLDCLELLVFSVAAIALLPRQLVDPDIGWHVAGGLWMLEHKAAPLTDPLGLSGNYWLCYSWLAELVMALVFHLGGFALLRLLQMLVVFGFILFGWFFLCSISSLSSDIRSAEESSVNCLGQRLSRLAGFAVFLLFTAPIWHLRPQLISVAFFALLLLRAERAALSWPFLTLLVVCWANTHVYWAIAPLVVLAYRLLPAVLRRDSKDALAGISLASLSAFCGIISPYGLRNVEGIYLYVFEHSEAYRDILEFQHLSPRTAGLLFWIVLVVVCGGVLSGIKDRQTRSEPLFLLFCLGGMAAFVRIKYLPLFGIVSAVFCMRGLSKNVNFWSRGTIRRNHQTGILTGYQGESDRLNKKKAFFDTMRRVLPAVCRKYFPIERKHISSPPDPSKSSTAAGLLAVALSALLLLLAVRFVDFPPPLDARKLEALTLARELAEAGELAGRSEISVLNTFNDGGWLALSFWLARKKGESESRLRTVIDGRTLVMGEARLAEYRQLMKQSGDWCAIINRWQIDAAMLPPESSLVKAIRASGGKTECGRKWSVLRETSHWVSFITSPM